MAKLEMFDLFEEIKETIFQHGELTKETINQIDQKHLKKISEDFIRDSKIFLMMNKSSEFFGVMILSINTKTDFTKNALFDVELNKDIEMVFNPFYISKDDKFETVMNKLIIELYRIILLHPEMYKEFNNENSPKKHEALDRSSDMNIYDLFKDDIRNIRYRSADQVNKKFMGLNESLEILQNLYNTADFKNDFNKEIDESSSFSYYYKKVLENLPDMDGGNMGMFLENDSNSPSYPGNPSNNNSHNWENQNMTNSSQLEEFVKKILSSNECLWKGRGLVSSKFESVLEKLKRKPAKIWKQIVTNAVISVPYKHKKTRNRLNRRQPENYKIAGELPDRKRHIVVVIDTSGSMSDETLSQVMSELYSVLQKLGNLAFTIIECDAEVQRVYDVTNLRDLKFNLTGRGGTEFSPAIRYLNENIKYRNSAVVIITDGYGESEIVKPLFNKLVWMVVTENDEKAYLSVNNLYGIKTVFKIEGNK